MACLGQAYLSDNCAIIDHESATLFLMPFATREMTKLAGSWCGTRGERDGKPLVGIEQCRIEFHNDGAAEYALLDQESEGSVHVRGVGIYKLMYLGIREPNGIKRLYAKGIYSVEGDTLKLVVFDDTAKMKPPVEGEKSTDPTKFEAKKDSGHIYFEFTRKKEIQKMVGAWECVSGVRDGKPVVDLSQNSILIRGDRSSELSLFGVKSKGNLQLIQYDTQKIFSIGTTDDTGKTKRFCWGIYSVVGDTLKVAIVDKTYKTMTELESAEQLCPAKFEAKKDSGHIYFEFARKPLEKPKK